MGVFDEDRILKEIRSKGTGGYELLEGIEIVPFEFDRFIVDVVLSSSERFLGIKDIKMNKDFLSHEQKMHSQGYYDDSEFYQQ